MDIYIKPVEKNEENGKLIMEWRNDEHTRQMCYNSDLKIWDKFKGEFEEKYYNNYIKPLFAYYNNIKIAFIGFVGNIDADIETNKNICKIGINICPEYRNKGLGKIIVNKSIEYIKKNFPLTKKIIAEIKPFNIASNKLFLSCNFKFIKTKKWNNIDMLVYHYDIKHILILAAHPDDETLGCGGTIKRLTKDNNNYIKLLTFTNGEGARNNNKDRREILEKVCLKLGINEFLCGDFPDNKLDSVPLLSLVKFIENNITFIPDIIFTHHRNCNNIDHVLVYKATITAFRPQNGIPIKMLSYFIPSSTDYNPFNDFRGQIYYNIEETIKDKLECLQLYDDEMRKYPHTRSYENIKNLSKVWGSEVCLKFAEKFELIREVN